jgi:hypothetical protein
MAATHDTNAEHIKPLEGAIIRRGTLGATTLAGQPVTLQSDGYWDPTDASAAQVTVAIAVQGGVAGDRVDLVRYGPVVCFTAATVGALIYASDTAGAFAEAAGTADTIIGYAESATVLFVQPQIITLS